jgi:hypothetical protein
MDLNHARLPIPPRGHCIQLLFAAFATLPPTCAIISGFVVLRQINFFTLAETALPTCCFFLPERPKQAGLPRKTEIIAQHFQMSKRQFPIFPMRTRTLRC